MEYTEIILRTCPLFQGLEGDALSGALEFFDAKPARYARGAILNRIGDPLPRFGLVLSGIVQVYTDDIDGNQMIMANVGAGNTFGESLCFLERDTAIYICAVTDVQLLWLSAERIKNIKPDCTPTDLMLANRFTAMLAHRTLDMNQRIQILSKRTLRDKLIALFSGYGKGTFTLPFNRADMASYIGTDRSALSRELSRMRAEGILDFHKNTFTVFGSLHRL